jgi:hypothetical protein
MAQGAFVPTYCIEPSCELHGDMLDPDWHFCPWCGTNLIAWGTQKNVRLVDRALALRYLLRKADRDSAWMLMVRPYHENEPHDFVEVTCEDVEECGDCDNSSGLLWNERLRQNVACPSCIGGYTIPEQWREFQLWRREGVTKE